MWLAREVAGRAAVGIDNASRYEQEHLVAELLQRAVLPEQLPEPPALDLAARVPACGTGRRGRAATGTTRSCSTTAASGW